MKRNPLFIKIVYLAWLILFSTASCKKQHPLQDSPGSPETAMEYFNFTDREIKAGSPGFSVDLNHDGRKDISFYTLLVGDPVNQQDKLQFLVQTNIGVNLPVNPSEEIPVMKHGDSIVVKNFSNYQWFELSAIVLVQKITSFTQPPVWEGHWRNAVKQYIPYQVLAENNIYSGWFEISTDIANERILLHKAGISKEPNKTVKAGI